MIFSKSVLAGLAAGVFIGAGVVLAVGGFSNGDTPGGNGAATDRAGEQEAGRQRGGFAPAVSLAVVNPAELGKRLDVIGEARAVKSVSLTSEATGIVETVNIAPGKKVAKGDVLLRLDDEQQRIALDRARSQYPIAKENADRYASLAETEAASALEAEAAYNNFKTVEADMRAAQFAVQQRTIRAPFDGVIGLTEIEAGDYVRAGDMVTTLDDTSQIVVEFSVPQEVASAVALEQSVEARLANGASGIHEGLISGIDSRVDPATRTLKMEATFANETGELLPGAIFSISTTSAGAPAVSVPGLAIQWDRSGPFVWKRSLDGSAARARVSILQRTDNIVLVDGELHAGDVIVSEGADRVRAGVRLPSPPGRRDESAAGASAAAPG